MSCENFTYRLSERSKKAKNQISCGFRNGDSVPISITDIKVILTICTLFLFQISVLGQGTAISVITGSYSTAVQNNYSENGGDASSPFHQSSTYNVIFGSASTANNDYALSATSSFTAGASFNFFEQATALKIRRNSVSASGEKEVIGGEHWTLPSTTSGATVEMRNTYFSDSESVLNSMAINMSMDQTFVNTGSLSFSNVERMDYVFPSGLRTATTNASGFAIFERGGNDHFQIAAILDIDLNGDPTRLGPLVYISSGSYGSGLKSLEQTVFYKEAFDTDYQPAKNITGQSIHGIFISFDDLTVQPNEVCYGYALLNYDVSSNDIDWTDGSIYPVTSGGAGGVDFCPGGAAFTSDGMLEDADHDDDGVSDLNDLDDDNDGILDTEERCSAVSTTTAYATQVIFNLGDPAVTPPFGDATQALGAPDWDGDVVDDPEQFVSVGLNAAYLILGWDADFYATNSGDANNDVAIFEVGIVESSFVSLKPTAATKDLLDDQGILTADFNGFYQIGIAGGAIFSFDIDAATANAFSQGELLFDQLKITSNETTSFTTPGTAGADIDAVEVYYSISCPERDTDGDSTADYLDLDSDNDGIYDAVESGSGEAQTAGLLNGGVDTDGIPLSVSNGSSGVDYTYADTDADSTLNPYDSDSDGDGCPDVTEAGFPDADGDQQLGGLAPPTVDAQGVVTSGGL